MTKRQIYECPIMCIKLPIQRALQIKLENKLLILSE